AEQQLTKGKFRRNLAMTHWGSRSAHVALQPPCSDETLRAVGLSTQTAALLAWEATHLVRLEVWPNASEQPMWFADGLGALVSAMYVKTSVPGSTDLDDADKGLCPDDPHAATWFVRAQDLLRRSKLPHVRSIVADAIDELDFEDRYAVRAVFFRFLKMNNGRFSAVTDAVRGTGGGPDYAKKVQAAVVKALGAGVAGVESEFTAFVQKARPKWEEVFRSLAVDGDGWQQIAFPDRNAVAWRKEPVHS